MVPEILFLKQEDVIKAGALDMKMTLEMAEKALKMWATGELDNPTKVGLHLDQHESFFISMPVYVGGDEKVAGFKWAAEARKNISDPTLPMGVDVTVLSNPDNVLPFCIMDATLITAMRTAASAALGVKYLCSKDSKKACLVGTGIVGRDAVMAVSEAVPTLEKIEIYDLNVEKAKALAEEFKDNAIPVVAVEDLAGSAKTSDIIVTMTSAQKGFFKQEWVKKGATVVQMGPCDLEGDVIMAADQLYVDNWYQIIGSAHGSVGMLHNAGKLQKEDTIELRYVAAGMAEGRKSDENQVVYCSLGLGAMDILIANQIYKNAKAMGIGQTVNLWDVPKYV